ncbi:hypothetical protein J4409_00295 [Candidatus Woesearchaeota archaeon]|nr:hypothetical protein [Candidatus Woesearchaeota archaeon]
MNKLEMECNYCRFCTEDKHVGITKEHMNYSNLIGLSEKLYLCSVGRYVVMS